MSAEHNIPIEIITVTLRGGEVKEIYKEPLADFMARGRAADCDCDQIACICTKAREHKKTCRYRKSLTCPVPIECEHGFDVCPICDPCTCKKAKKKTNLSNKKRKTSKAE